MKTAVVYYSMSGNTEQIAKKLAEKLGADVIRIEPVKENPSKGFKKFLWGGKSAVMGDTPALQPYRFDGSYDRIILGTPLWAGTFTPPIRSFIKENQAKLSGKKLAAFVCCAGGNADKAFVKLKEAVKADKLDAQMTLTDPKNQPSSEVDEKIKAFCDKLGSFSK
ncbi:MAG: flavodoxin family protein [Ruminococcus sp.]|nr:flavodoxin family protein [Ruminococcus sp.]